MKLLKGNRHGGDNEKKLAGMEIIDTSSINNISTFSNYNMLTYKTLQ